MYSNVMYAGGAWAVGAIFGTFPILSASFRPYIEQTPLRIYATQTNLQAAALVMRVTPADGYF